MPSPIWRTVPTSARSVSTSYCSIRCLRIEVISSGRSFKVSSPHQVVSQPFQSSADARVDAHRPDLQDDAADQAGVDAARRLDGPSRGLLDLAHDRGRLLVRQLLRRRQLDLEAALLARHQPLELAPDLLDLPDPPLLRREPEKVPQQLVRVAEQLLEHAGLRARL